MESHPASSSNDVAFFFFNKLLKRAELHLAGTVWMELCDLQLFRFRSTHFPPPGKKKKKLENFKSGFSTNGAPPPDPLSVREAGGWWMVGVVN